MCAAVSLPLLSITGVAFGCAPDGQPTVVKSAPLPEGWPSLTPVGEVQVKTYPAYRAAVARRTDAPASSAAAPSQQGAAAAGTTANGPRSDRQTSSSLFMVLFRHIDDEGIPMTAPVRMDYSTGGGAARMSGMAFLYESQETGVTGPDGQVMVEDVQAQTVVSVGVRGDYTTERMEQGMALLEQWLEVNAAEWQRAGEPMYLGYNGPFTPSAMRYGEVQVPVRPRAKPEADAGAEPEAQPEAQPGAQSGAQSGAQ